ncbi:MAG: type II secretion system protein [Oscillospiraceae bacterium]|nr:type II secretion system protein [Oscillospiraceae bacterium]
MKYKIFKGITLFEVVIVLLITGILAGVLIPNYILWIGKTKYRAAVSQAEVIYDSVQTIVQNYEIIDRSIRNPENKKLAGIHICGNLSYGQFTDDEYSELYKKIISYYEAANECSWAVKIDNYKIIAVYYSDSETDEFVGIYPEPADFDDYIKGDIGTKINEVLID